MDLELEKKKKKKGSQSLNFHSSDDLSEFAKYLVSLDWFSEFLTHKAEYSTVHKNPPESRMML